MGPVTRAYLRCPRCGRRGVYFKFGRRGEDTYDTRDPWARWDGSQGGEHHNR